MVESAFEQRPSPGSAPPGQGPYPRGEPPAVGAFAGSAHPRAGTVSWERALRQPRRSAEAQCKSGEERRGSGSRNDVRNAQVLASRRRSEGKEP